LATIAIFKENKQMNELKPVNKGGRPRGSGEAQQITQRLRREIYSALDICKKNGHPLDMLLSEQIQQDAAGTLSKLSKFVPQEVSLGGEGSAFALALGEVAARIADSLPEGEPNNTQLIDITPEKTDDQQ